MVIMFLQCCGDADASIVSTVLDFACAGENVCLITADTDLLTMLIYMWNDMMRQIKMKSKGTRKCKKSVRDVGQIASTLGDIQKYLAFIHAFGGCDTTSAIFGQGKLSILRLLSSKSKKRSLAAREAADVFCASNATPEQIRAAGLRTFVLLYGGKDTDNLPSLRYAKYMKMASTISSVKPKKLPQQRGQRIFILFVFLIKYKNGTLYAKIVQMQPIGAGNFRMEH